MATQHTYISLSKLSRFLNKLKTIFIQSVTTGSANGTISVDGADVAVKNLKSAAYTESSAYATAAQGAKADTAVQPAALNNLANTVDGYASWYEWQDEE